MRRQTLLTLLTAAMLVLAGCAGSTGGDGSPTADGPPTPDAGDDDTTTATGTVQFYVSDDPGQIEDFRHLNVTISQIGFERAGDADDEGENETTPETTTAATTDTASDDGTSTTTTGESTTDTADGETDDPESDGGDGWLTHNVSSRTVDLTQLRGDNATLIDSPELPAGEYSTVFVHVSDINATLADGTSANVKLPSNKLQLNKGFTLEPNGTVSFVYDITVFKAGNSGKYILKPVISESGPDKEVNDVGDDPEDSDDGDDGDEETDGTEAGGPPDERTRN